MALTPGARIGPYEVLAAIGVGGMGEVYRARDARLKRDVALKVLPDGVAGDRDRAARFQREAELLAALTHPHVASLYGLEETTGSDGAVTHALVMELVEGETLADRLVRGPVPVDEALAIARQLAEALDYAHEHGVLHRDLKPANIKLTSDGQVKVLDFGLAKALDSGAGRTGSAERAGERDITQSPTLTSPAAITGVGVLLGTAAYMSPEQARGQAVDKRADIWALGAVLYELLAGTRAFPGETVTDTLAGVIKSDPDWTRLPESTPASVRTLLARCLDRSTRSRLRDMGEALHSLNQPKSGVFGAAIDQQSGQATPSRRFAGGWLVVATAAGLSAVAGAAIAWSLRPAPSAPQTAVTRFAFDLPKRSGNVRIARQFLTISRDGTRAFLQLNPGTGQNGSLWVRRLDGLEPDPIKGAEFTGSHVVLSPDERWLAFWAAGQIRKISVDGGTPAAVATTNNDVWGMTWRGAQILFGSVPEGIMTVPESGGSASVAVAAGQGEWLYGPQAVPGSDFILFTAKRADAPNWNEAQVVAQSLTTGERRVLIQGGRDARIVPSGHLLFARGSVVFAQSFDPGSVTIHGSAIPVLDDVEGGAIDQNGASHFAVSDNGSLVYYPRPQFGTRTLVWRDRRGLETPLNAPPHSYVGPRLAPDGSQIVVGDEAEQDLWTWNLAGETLTRLTSAGSGGNGLRTDWMPDSKHIVRGVGNAVVVSATDGSGEEVVTRTQVGAQPYGPSPDGNNIPFLLGADLFVVSRFPPHEVRTLVKSPAIEARVVFHPNGRWFAYQATDSGRYEIYVKPFPDTDRTRWTVSTEGGEQPLWSPRGDELFYVNGKNQLVSVQIGKGDAFTQGKSTVIFPDAGPRTGAARNYDISPDGSRFLMVKELAPAPPPRIVVVEHWLDEVKRKVH
ncbi:MAG: protein kinase [Vicinamibacterales bacterium]